ncbi:MAG: beta-ketoacyl-ACP synthase II [Eggerthellaceae bacterium]|nr:beta-ketoacyl-ACP synthase II [Eggerthellaceae bacterium]
MTGTDMKRPDGSQRVVITGMGAVSPAGVGVDALWSAVKDGKCCIGPIERFDVEGYEVKNAAEVRGFDGTEHGLTKKEARRFERFVQYAIVAADEAISSSGLDMDSEDPTRVAVYFGTGIGGIDELQKGFDTLSEKGPKRVSPLFVPTMIGNIAAGNLAIRYGMKGSCMNAVTACATGAHNIGEAVRAIRHGYADVALVGGAEESVSPICIAGFANLGALSKSEDPTCASLPFDARREGFVAGEGAGALIIESLEHAKARGAKPIAEIVGYGTTGDAYHVTAPDPDGNGIALAMEQALAEGGFVPEDIGHLNAHGTGTPMNDKTEATALAILCGEDLARRIPVTSIKGSVGHTLGAAGALEAIVCALSVANGALTPTCGFAEADPEVPLSVVTEYTEGVPQKVALSTSLGFGGHNACLAISPVSDEL